MARKDNPYLPLYVQDFMTDEKLIECSAESTGVYIRLMCVMHKSEDYGVILLKQKDKQSENNVTNFAVKLARQMPYDIDTITRSLTELIEEGVLTLDGDKLYQKRMVKDAILSDARSSAGRRGGTKSKGQSSGSKFACDFAQAKSQANAENEIESDTDTDSESNKDCNLRQEVEPTSREGSPDESQDEGFAEFWARYPRKVGKGAALKSWRRHRPSRALREKIMAALEAAVRCDQWLKDGGQYIPNPATWLNQERWDDEYKPSSYIPRGSYRTSGKPGMDDTISILADIYHGDEGGGAP